MSSDKYSIRKIKNALILGVKKTFEKMAFIDVNEIKKYDHEINFKHILYVDILEPILGKIVLYLPYECKKMIAENIYGQNLDELNIEEIDDSQLEILNVLVGNFLSYYYGRKKKYKIDLPKILFDEDELYWKKSNSHCLFFDAEGIVFKLVIELRRLV